MFVADTVIVMCVFFLTVMKFKRMSCFMEFAALLLQKALHEDQLELLIQCGQEIFSWIKRSACVCLYVCMCVYISV